MTRPDPTPGTSPLALVRARAALRAAGLDPTTPLELASSTSNMVWLSPTHVVRASTGLTTRLTREATVAAALPARFPYPRVVAHGSGAGDDWLVVERVRGAPLAHLWPGLDDEARAATVHDVGAALALLHRTPAPPGLDPLDHPPQLLHPGPDPLCSLWVALEQLASLAHVDRGMVAEAARLVDEWSTALDPGPARTLVHGDLTFENVLHDGEQVTAVLDLEWSRPAPADLDLDVLLRMCAHPDLHVGDDHVGATRRQDYVRVPRWLAEAHPGLVAAPRLGDRLRLYAVAFEVRSLLDDPPDRPAATLGHLHPVHRLARLLSGRSHLDAEPTSGLLARATADALQPQPRPAPQTGANRS